jgi:hypothetical protein
MKHVVVLGGGMVGRAIARDLSTDCHIKVTVVDQDPHALAEISYGATVDTIQADLSDPRTWRLLSMTLTLLLVLFPAFWVFMTLRTVLNAGKNYCDISFFPEDASELDALAKTKGVTAVVDCGVAPGMSNMIVGHVHARLDTTNEVVILVGGLPKKRLWPYEYKAPFSPIDVIEEYVTMSMMQASVPSKESHVFDIAPPRGWVDLNLRELWESRELAYFLCGATSRFDTSRQTPLAERQVCKHLYPAESDRKGSRTPGCTVDHGLY